MNMLMSMRPDPPDARDWRYAQVKKEKILEVGSSLPAVLDLRPQLLGVRDQGTDGACAAFVGSCIKEFQERVERNFQEYFSPQFIYNLRPNPYTSGMTARDLLKILQKDGVVPERQLPYRSQRVLSKEMLEGAKVNRIKSYARISSIEEAKVALYENGPLLFALPVFTSKVNQFWRKQAGTAGFLLGGHAIAAVGYNEEGFILRNSWGPRWGDQGHVIFPYSDWSVLWDIYTALDLPYESPPKAKVPGKKPVAPISGRVPAGPSNRDQPKPQPQPQPQPQPKPQPQPPRPRPQGLKPAPGQNPQAPTPCIIL